MPKRRKGGARRRNPRLQRRITALLLVAGAALTTCGLFLPWAEVDPEGYGMVEDVLAWFGWIPPAGDPVRGFEIPARVRESASLPGVVTWRVMEDLGAGRLDRAAARLLFGEQFEEEWAPIVLLPTVLALMNLLLLRRRRSRLLAPWLALAELLVFATFAFAAHRVHAGTFSVPLRLMGGVPVTLTGTLLGAAACLRKARS